MSSTRSLANILLRHPAGIIKVTASHGPGQERSVRPWFYWSHMHQESHSELVEQYYPYFIKTDLNKLSQEKIGSWIGSCITLFGKPEWPERGSIVKGDCLFYLVPDHNYENAGLRFKYPQDVIKCALLRPLDDL